MNKLTSVPNLAFDFGFIFQLDDFVRKLNSDSWGYVLKLPFYVSFVEKLNFWVNLPNHEVWFAGELVSSQNN